MPCNVDVAQDVEVAIYVNVAVIILFLQYRTGKYFVVKYKGCTLICQRDDRKVTQKCFPHLKTSTITILRGECLL